MKILVIINDPPYGTERAYNGLRLVNALARKDNEVTVFLMADAVAVAKANQKTPDGYYNLERMLRQVLTHGQVLLCGSCMDARGLAASELVTGASRSTLETLAEATLAADKVLVF